MNRHVVNVAASGFVAALALGCGGRSGSARPDASGAGGTGFGGSGSGGAGGALSTGGTSGSANDGGGGNGSAYDGVYQCVGKTGGGSCDEPLATRTWSLTIAGGQATIDFVGEVLPNLTPEFGCTGNWVGDQLDCTTQWVRQGRTCTADIHLRPAAANALSFWTGAADMSQVLDRADCAK